MFTRGDGSGRARKMAAPGLSFIGPDVVVSGHLSTGAQVHLDGRVDGDVRCDVLVQGDSGVVAGNIVADEARIAGLVDGTVTARLVTLEPTARVTGDVSYETLSIAAGARIEGRLTRRADTQDPVIPIRPVDLSVAGSGRKSSGPAPLFSAADGDRAAARG